MNNSLLFKRFLKTKHYYEICREERNFAAILYHFLLDKNNLKLFFTSILNEDIIEDDLKCVEIYYEYACLRDIWDKLKEDNNGNQKKGQYIAKFLDLDEKYEKSHFDEKEIIIEFNKQFGAKSEKHIENPGNWKLKDLLRLFEKNQELFLSACMLKWAFNIKPDIVIIIPGKEIVPDKVICLEAKVESSEDKYPSGNKTKFSEKLTGYKAKNDNKKYNGYLTESTREKDKYYVTQTKMQKFLFEEVFEFKKPETKHYIIKSKPKNKKSGKTTKTEKEQNETIYWEDIFKEMNNTNNFVAKFLKKNEHLQ